MSTKREPLAAAALYQQRIEELQKGLNSSDEEMAEKLGIKIRTYEDIRNGYRIPRLTVCRIIDLMLSRLNGQLVPCEPPKKSDELLAVLSFFDSEMIEIYKKMAEVFEQASKDISNYHIYMVEIALLQKSRDEYVRLAKIIEKS